MGKRPDHKARIGMAKRYIKTTHSKLRIAKDHGFLSPGVVDTSIRHALEGGHITKKQLQKAESRRAGGSRLTVTKPLLLLPKSILPKPVHDYLYTNKPVSKIAMESGLRTGKAVLDWANALRKKGVLSGNDIDKAKNKMRKGTPMTLEASTSIRFLKAEWSGSIKLKRGREPKPLKKKGRELPPPEPRVDLHPAIYDLLYTKKPLSTLVVEHGFNSTIDLLKFARKQALKQLDKKPKKR